MPRGHRRGDRKKNTNAAAVAERAERTAIFGKTKMCKFFILGVCAKGRECCFAHDPSEMNPAPDLSRTKICKTLINTGFCDEPNCKYAHNKEELRAVPTEPSEAQDEPPRPTGRLDLSSKIPKLVNQPMPSASAHPMMGFKPGQGMPPEVLQQLASNMAAVQMTMMQMAVQAQANKSKPEPSSHPTLPLAALTQTEAFTRQSSIDSNGGSNTEAAVYASGVQSSFASGMPDQETPDGGVQPGSGAFRPIQGQAAAVMLADALGGSNVPGSAKGQSHSGDQSSLQGWPNNAGFSQGSQCAQLSIQDAPTAGGPMLQDSSYSGLLPSQVYSGHQAPECLQNVLPSDSKSQGQYSSFHDAGTTAAVKDALYDMQSPAAPSPAIHHVSTWDGDLNELEEHLAKDLADSGCYQGSADERPQMRIASSLSGVGALPMSEKRMQDTPIFAAGAAILTPETSHDLATVYEGDVSTAYQGELNPSLDEHPSRQRNLSDMDGVTVKNTFLEFPCEQPFVGMRAVQTAAGRLDCLVDSWGQEE